MELLINLISYFIVNLNECSKRIKYSQNILKMKNLLKQSNITEKKYNINENIFCNLNQGFFKSFDYNNNINLKKKKEENGNKKSNGNYIISDEKIDLNEFEENLKNKSKKKKAEMKLNESVNTVNFDNLNITSDLSPILQTKKRKKYKFDNDDSNLNLLNFSSMSASNFNSFNNNIGSRQKAIIFANKIRTPLIRAKSQLNKKIGKYTNSNWINTLSNLSYSKKNK